MDDIRSWMNTNFLKLNAEKNEYILLGSNKLISKINQDTSLSLSSNDISPVPSARNIGVIFDQYLTMESHVNNICKVCYFNLRNISKIRKNLTSSSVKTFVHTFIASRLDNCNSLLIGTPSRITLKLQKVQNAAARLITRKKYHDHITPILLDLHWLPIVFRIQFKILLLTFKCLNNFAPVYLSSLLDIYTPSRTLRSSSDNFLLVHKSARLLSFGDRSFTIQAPKLWNILPFKIRCCTSLITFKSLLKIFLFKKAFNL